MGPIAPLLQESPKWSWRTKKQLTFFSWALPNNVVWKSAELSQGQSQHLSRVIPHFCFHQKYTLASPIAPHNNNLSIGTQLDAGLAASLTGIKTPPREEGGTLLLPPKPSWPWLLHQYPLYPLPASSCPQEAGWLFCHFRLGLAQMGPTGPYLRSKMQVLL